MATTRPKPKTPTDALREKWVGLVEDAAARMTPREFAQAERNVDAIIEQGRARASRERKRGKA